MEFIRIALPVDLAGELVDNGAAVCPYETRGAADEAFRMVIGDVNTAATVVTSVVTLSVAAEAVRKFAGRLWARARKSDEEVMTVTIAVPGQDAPRELKVRRDDAAGADKILDFLIEALPASRS